LVHPLGDLIEPPPEQVVGVPAGLSTDSPYGDKSRAEQLENRRRVRGFWGNPFLDEIPVFVKGFGQ
jgi:hypothetical protein